MECLPMSLEWMRGWKPIGEKKNEMLEENGGNASNEKHQKPVSPECIAALFENNAIFNGKPECK